MLWLRLSPSDAHAKTKSKDVLRHRAQTDGAQQIPLVVGAEGLGLRLEGLGFRDEGLGIRVGESNSRVFSNPPPVDRDLSAGNTKSQTSTSQGGVGCRLWL